MEHEVSNVWKEMAGINIKKRNVREKVGRFLVYNTKGSWMVYYKRLHICFETEGKAKSFAKDAEFAMSVGASSMNGHEFNEQYLSMLNQ